MWFNPNNLYWITTVSFGLRGYFQLLLPVKTLTGQISVSNNKKGIFTFTLTVWWQSKASKASFYNLTNQMTISYYFRDFFWAFCFVNTRCHFLALMPKSVCNHKLSVVCHRPSSLLFVDSPPGHRVAHTNFIFCKFIYAHKISSQCDLYF